MATGPGDYAGSPGSLATAIGVSQTVGYAALKDPNARIAGSPGFGSGPIYTFDGGPHIGWITYSFGPVPTAAAESTSTGVTPTETSYALYGHIIPLSVFGVGRIGGDIISGPFVENGLATFCISFGVPADPYGTRTLREIAFDSEVVWENGAFNVEPFTFRFYPGRLDQVVDPIETAHWGTDAIAYRPQILLWFENLPLPNTKFGKIPYVAALLGDSSDDVNLGEAFERLATSPWVGYTSDEFETVGVTDSLISGGLIIAQDAEFLSTIQQFGRFYRNWNILQTDKLRIVDRGAVVTADIALDRTTMANQIVFARGETSTIPRVLELSTIDPEADYTVVPSQAVRPREPVNVTASVSTETVYLPMIMDSTTRQSLVTYTKYQEEVARKKVTGTAMMYGVQIEPGDLVAITGLGADFEDTTFKVIETLHGANYTVEFTAEAILSCETPSVDLFWSYVILLMGYEPGKDLLDESVAANGIAHFLPDQGYVDATRAKFGSQSLRPNVWYTYDFSDWTLSHSNSDEFTVECWARLDSTLSDLQAMISGSLATVVWEFAVNGTELRFGYQSQTAGFINVDSSAAGIVGGQWYHLAVDKDSSGKIRLYRNGVMVGSATPSDSSMATDTIDLMIGAMTYYRTNVWIGNLDEVRVTTVARYKSDGGFAVPTSPWPREGIP